MKALFQRLHAKPGDFLWYSMFWWMTGIAVPMAHGCVLAMLHRKS